MIRKTVLLSILSLLLISPLMTEGADWLYFIEDGKGDKFYIDMDSIRQIKPHLFSLLKKVEPGDSPDISYVVSSIVMDCEGGRLKLLKETVYLKNGKSRAGRIDREFRKITEEDIDESLMELVCSLKKAG